MVPAEKADPREWMEPVERVGPVMEEGFQMGPVHARSQMGQAEAE